jgi:endo-1,4-beta-D-glucanase Y
MQATLCITRILCFSLAAASLAAGAAAEPVSRPFPQHTVYAAGTIKPANVSQDTLDRETSAFYDLWKRKSLVPANTPGEFYVAFGEPDAKADRDVVSVSEGHGYGMLIVTYMAGYDPDAKRSFDGLYRFYKSHPSKNNPRLMSWSQDRKHMNAVKGRDSASDGDLDIAYALLLANRQWGSDGGIDYLGEARAMIDAILADDINRVQSSVKLGDDIRSDDPAFADTRSSDLMPGHFRVFHQTTGRAEWNAVLEKTYALMQSLQKAHSPQTGLLPDFICHVDADPRPAKPKYLESKHDGAYFYNACRLPFRVALDFLISGEPRAKAVLEPINRWIRQKTGDNPAKIAAGYSLSGKEIDTDSQMCFVAPLAVAAMVDRENQAWLNDASAFVVQSKDDSSYYDSTIKLLCLLALSGNWWSP